MMMRRSPTFHMCVTTSKTTSYLMKLLAAHSWRLDDRHQWAQWRHNPSPDVEVMFCHLRDPLPYLMRCNIGLSAAPKRGGIIVRWLASRDAWGRRARGRGVVWAWSAVKQEDPFNLFVLWDIRHRCRFGIDLEPYTSGGYFLSLNEFKKSHLSDFWVCLPPLARVAFL